MAALYELGYADSDIAPTAEEVTAFGASTGAFALYPCARAYAQDVSTRLGLPPLTLSIYRVPISSPEGATVEAPAATSSSLKIGSVISVFMTESYFRFHRSAGMTELEFASSVR